jgi:hypothetical protein
VLPVPSSSPVKKKLPLLSVMWISEVGVRLVSRFDSLYEMTVELSRRRVTSKVRFEKEVQA